MSSNRLTDDTCTYKKALRQSVGPLEYMLEPVKYVHERRCRMQLGIVGGNTVSTPAATLLVDTESELRNQTRAASLCPTNHYIPGRDFVKNDMDHLRECQLVNYRGVPGPAWVPPTRGAGGHPR